MSLKLNIKISNKVIHALVIIAVLFLMTGVVAYVVLPETISPTPQDIVASFASPDSTNIPNPGHSSDSIVVRVGDLSVIGSCSGDISLQEAIDRDCFGGTSNVSSDNTPIGGIIMYSGSWDFDGTGLGTGSLEGWALCNGNNGTPNLSDRFVMGTVSLLDLGVTGGLTSHTHEAGTYASSNHDHSISNHTHSVSDHSHSFSGTTGSSGSSQTGYNDEYNRTLRYAPYNHSHSYSGNTGSDGGGSTSSDGGGNTSSDGAATITGTSAATSNLPPYIQLAFIMKLP